MHKNIVVTAKKVFGEHYIGMQITNNYTYLSSINNYKVSGNNKYSNQVNCITELPSVYYPALPSFTSMKKNQFTGNDLMVVEKFKAPIQNFNTNGDLQDWASKRYDEIVEKDYDGRTEAVQQQRKEIIKEWNNYLSNENKEYSNTQKLLILNGITKELKPTEDTIPPVLNKGVLADVMYGIKSSSDSQFNFLKTYRTKLRELYTDDTTSCGSMTKWVKIPSKANDPDNFDDNVEELKALSHQNWCTKSFNAEPYLSKGDFHIYLEDGEPKIGIRFVSNHIEEIQGEENNGTIPVEYYDEVKNYTENERLVLGVQAKRELSKSEESKKELTKIKEEIMKMDGNTEKEKLFNYMKIPYSVDNDGNYKIHDFDWNFDFSYRALGLSEKNPFKNVKTVLKDVKLGNSKITNLADLEVIGRDAYLENSRINSLSKLKRVYGSVNLNCSDIKDLGELERIDGSLKLSRTKLDSLKHLKYIGGNLNASYSKLSDIGELEHVSGCVHLNEELKDQDIDWENICEGKVFYRS